MTTASDPSTGDGKKPMRVRLSRAKGWRMPPDTVKVDRSTIWGNPFVPMQPAPLGPSRGTLVRDTGHAFELYRESAPFDADFAREARRVLKGKNLACWCPLTDPDQCHAAVLLAIANAP